MSDIYNVLEPDEAVDVLKGVALVALDLCARNVLVFDMPDGSRMPVVEVADDTRMRYEVLCHPSWRVGIQLGKEEPVIGLRFHMFLICGTKEVLYLRKQLHWWSPRAKGPKLWVPGK